MHRNSSEFRGALSWDNAQPLTLNTVHIMDSVEGMFRLSRESIDLVFADPPYNLGVSYGNGSDRRQYYLDWCRLWFEGVYRILKPGGSFYAMQYPETCADWLPLLRARFTFKSWITWHYPTNIGQSPRNYTRSQRTVLFCTKGVTPAYFNGMADPQPYRNPGDKRIRAIGKGGTTPYDTWLYNLVKNVSKEKTLWPNQVPLPLVERIVKVSCPPDGIVCDPFMGSGTTALAAARAKRSWIGFDIAAASAAETERRIGCLRSS